MSEKEISEGVNKLQIEETDLNNDTISSEEEDHTDNDASMDEEELAMKMANEQRQEALDHIEKTYGLTTIPDSNVEQLPADSELTNDIPLDTTYIDLIHLKIKSIEELHLERFPHLESLNLRDNLITSLNALKLLPDSSKQSMEELDFYDNRIKHISKHISEYPNLQLLDLSFNNIKHIKHLEPLIELRQLFFVQNRITKIENIESLTKLENLEFGGNKIEIIENLNSLKNLTQLWLGQNRINKLQNLDSLRNLRVLSIQSNKINKLQGLDQLGNLEELYISHNKLTKLEGLSKLTKLSVLDVTGNQIEKVEGLETLCELTDFWCSYNKIDSFDNVCQGLSQNGKLETVYFEGNPIQLQNPTMYRTKLKMALGPSLLKIDALYLTTNKMVT